MQDGERPGEARQQQPGVALDDGAVAPVEAQRIDQHDDAGEAEQDAGQAAPADRLADQQRQRHHPQHGRVGEHARAAGRHALHAEIGEGEEAGELEGADRQHDRPVGAVRPAQAAEAASRTKAVDRRQGGARRGEPHRRAGRQADLDDRPGQPEQHDGRRRAARQRACRLLGARHSRGAS